MEHQLEELTLSRLDTGLVGWREYIHSRCGFFYFYSKLKPAEERGIFNFLLFVRDVHVLVWYQTLSPVSARVNDLRFLQQLTEYKDQEILQATTTTFHRHLW